MIESPICLLFWGRKGGGAVLTDQLESVAKSLGLSVHVSKRPQRKGRLLRNLSLSGWYKHRRETIQCLVDLDIKVVIVAMPSPWDLFLKRKLQKNGIRISRIIHDAQPHPGELFPPKFWTWLLLHDADRIVVLSEFVRNRLSKWIFFDNSKIIKSVLPSAPLQIARIDSVKTPEKKVLFIGRGRKYKGQARLEKAWELVPGETNRLYIVGKGHKVPRNKNRVIIVPDWVSDGEFQRSISNCDLVVLPYSEASQSGIIPIAHMLGKPVVVTPVGGLSEQVIHGVNGLVSSSLSSNDFAQAIEAALQISWRIPKYDNNLATQKLLFDCLEG